jgi:hypothetical protein
MKKRDFFKTIYLSILVMLLGLMMAQPAFAQETQELSLRLSRDFGYSSGMGAIQGTFSMRVTGPDNLSRVEYFLDETKIGEVDQAPFNLRFSTDNFELGNHRLFALGYTQDGKELRSNEIQVEFVSASAGMEAVGSILIPVLVVVGLGMLFSFVATLASSRKLEHLPPGAARKYGSAGGAICPKCQRPFSRNFLSPNMLVGKLERCPFCGKWSIVPARSMQDLKAAEQAEIQDAILGAAPGLDEEEKLRQELEKSRFQDL